MVRKVEYDSKEREIYVKWKVHEQTMYMVFQWYDWSYDSVCFNVVLNVYSKRKNADSNEDVAKITGKHPVESFLLARKAFLMLERAAIEGWGDNYNIGIRVGWADNRRRDAYAKFLIPHGYRWANIGGKCLYKVYKKGESIIYD